jgi:hypothetical protein
MLALVLLGAREWYFLQSRTSVSSRAVEGVVTSAPATPLPTTQAPPSVTPAPPPAAVSVDTSNKADAIVKAPAVERAAEQAVPKQEPRQRGDEPGRNAQAQREEQAAAERQLEDAVRSTERPSAESQSKADPPSQPPREGPASPAMVELPAGLELNVRLSTTLNSGRLHVEDRFEATTEEDVNVNGRTVVPAGSVMRGVVSSVEPASHTNRTARMTLAFDQLTANGEAYPIRARVTQAIAGTGLKGEATKIAVSGGVGGIIGGLLGGAKGAVAGTVIGSGGSIAATEGKQIELAQGAVLRARLDASVQIHQE